MPILDTPFPLTDLPSLRGFADIKGAKLDPILQALINGVSRQIEEWLNLAVELKARTKDFDLDRDQRRIDLETAPITGITSVTHDLNRDFTGSALGTDEFTFDRDTGHLELEIALAAGRKVLRVVYTGGIAATLQGLRSLAPDLELACQLQCKEIVNRQTLSGLEANISEQGGSVRVTALALLPYVRQLLQPYRRLGTGY